MAEYTVNLKLAVQGSKELDKLNKKIDKTRKHLNKADIGSDKFNKSIEKLIQREKGYAKALSTRTKAIDNALRAATGMQTLEQREHQLLIRGNKLRDLRAKKDRALNRQKAINRGVGGAVGSGIIGGGFPLLFGQGPTAAIGGALGGVAGGALSAIPGMGQFGFALSIAGTAIGSALNDLSKALAKPTENIQSLVEKFGLTGTATGDLALELEKLGLKSSAAKLLLEQGAEQFGLTADEVEINTQKMQEFENAINKLGTQITLFLADNLMPLIDALSKIPFESIAKKLEPLINLLMFGQFESPSETVNRMKGISNIPTGEGSAIIGGVKLNPDFGKPGLGGTGNLSAGPSNDLARKVFEQKELLPLKQKLELEQNRLVVSSEKLNLMKEEFELTNLDNELQLAISENEKLSSKELTQKIEKLKIARDTQQQLVDNTKALIDPMRQISNIMAQDMGNALKGLIQGTQTLNEALKNVLNNMASSFLNLGIFGNVAGVFTPGEGLLGSIFKANGGPVKGGSSYIVGEKGPELFTPGVSGMITPNNQLGGSTNVVVNVDASGSAVEGDEDRGRELGRLISVAVQSEIVQQKRPGGLLA